MTFPGINTDINLLAQIAEQYGRKMNADKEQLMDLAAIIENHRKENKKTEDDTDEKQPITITQFLRALVGPDAVPKKTNKA